ncbi:family 10 glycosylhydrolase [Entomospira entomophila]|uniref:Family 10 glycosylhydrolase n=1 Tax=Entomospira entomophila TaxID=2719988 RepID=A0A968KRY6_9SPIO|nr:family 10 glycosylhydrolase [Entomospira entomophilus]NIZ41248.1 family 10 glycosylhydrolase [Entomospira entomophilus]WDI35453.1 family 10 glycosylhydrolase [Entomospira entomophilus]
MYIRNRLYAYTLLSIIALSLVSCPQKPTKTNDLETVKEFKGINRQNQLVFGETAVENPHQKGSAPVKIVKNYIEPKEMVRAVWIGTISQLHYPRKNQNGTPRIKLTELQNDWIEILRTAEDLNLNMIIFQVSPMLDALYASEYRPWSQFINAENKQGVAPEWADSFDLVAWMIEETHQRGMEFHAWFNPYRVTAGGSYTISLGSDGTLEGELSVLDENNFAKQNPAAAYLFNKKVYLDPGLDVTLDHIDATIEEFLNRYDVDAIHFDDYFYPYPIFVDGGRIDFAQTLSDRETFRANPRKFTFIEDIESEENLARYQAEATKWRNDNNNRMVQRVKAVIDSHNAQTGKAVQWGISPFGIWAHQEENPLGSATPTGSTSSYRDIFADTLKWSEEEWIDYIMPQIYWNFETKAAPYATLAYWWQDALKNSSTQLYVGHPNYKTGAAWNNYLDITNQIRYNAQFPAIQGSAFFSYNDLLWQPITNQASIVRNKELISLRDHMQNITLIPAKPWLDRKETLPLKFLHFHGEDLALTFHDSLLNDSRFYVIYGINKNEISIIKVVGRNKEIAKQRISFNAIDLQPYSEIGISIKDFAGVENSMQKISLIN